MEPYLISAVFAVVVVILFLIFSHKSYIKVKQAAEKTAPPKKAASVKGVRAFMSVAVFVLAFNIVCLPLVLGFDFVSAQSRYYDIFGSKYDSFVSVPLYDKEGNMYTLDKDNERYISDSKSYEFGEIYLTEGGYITIINPQDIEVEYRITNYTNYYFSMGTDTYYSVSYGPYWDNEGNLHLINEDEELFVIEKERQEAFRTEEGVNIFDKK
ncbi:MAG TPA: hypothetical protein IAA24_01895 [Candidatus Eubacterium faecigallinarum]|nr:hypothetical protein [Candidatus Eubacterium faecigallinarum]